MFGRCIRVLLPILLLAGLAACAGQAPPSGLSVTQEAAAYRAHARASYPVPGPRSDPWGPYIVEASARFDVPQSWIRGVIRQESGGRQDALSTPGAMGLMQIMAPTYDELRQKFSLGGDPYNPHDNILAGTAYIRQLYESYGTPAFLAAYDAGMGRLDDYILRNRPLPNETRRYVASVGPRIAGDLPRRRSSTDLMVARAATRPAPGIAPVLLASRVTQPAPRVWRDSVAEAPMPPARVQLASARMPAQARGWRALSRARGSLIPSAMAAVVPARYETEDRTWAIQVGAFGSAQIAGQAASGARQRDQILQSARPQVMTLRDARGVTYRARLVGLSRAGATAACEHLGVGRCLVISPAS